MNKLIKNINIQCDAIDKYGVGAITIFLAMEKLTLIVSICIIWLGFFGGMNN